MKVYIINPVKKGLGAKTKTDTSTQRGHNMARKRKSRSRKRKAYRRNPVAKRRSTRRRYRRNPAGGAIMKQAFSKNHIIKITSLGVGFVGGIKAQKFINGVEALANFRRFTGAIPFILGTVLAVKSKKEAVKAVGAGISLSGLYDLVTQNVPQNGLSPVEGVDLDDDMYYGTAIDVDGTAIDVDGEDIDVVGQEDDDDIVVGEEDSPYAMV